MKKVAILFSGGKDSCLALSYALKHYKVSCLITIISENPYSYMFHTPNIKLTRIQAKTIGLPIIIKKTIGEKEKELKDLKKAIEMAKEKYKIEGIVTGALASVYQYSRIKKICTELSLECINPLWQKSYKGIVNEIIKQKFDVIITAVASEGLDESWLGKKINKKSILELDNLSKKYRFNLAFEGGEAETFVLWAPFFKKHLKIVKSHVEGENLNKTLIIDKIKII